MNTDKHMNSKKIWLLALLAFIPVKSALAHCPLCTMGVAVAAGGAYWLGVKTIVISLFVGAFAVSTGWWVSKLVKKDYFKYQRLAIIMASFVLTIVPLLPLFTEITPWYVSFFGSYGSLLNRTYVLNTFLVGSVVGGLIVSITPALSAGITRLRQGKMINFQGVVLTLVMLLLTGTVLQLL